METEIKENTRLKANYQPLTTFLSLVYLGLTQVFIGEGKDLGGWYGMRQSLASFEFYLRALSQIEIAEAMKRSMTLPFNPNCTSDLNWVN